VFKNLSFVHLVGAVLVVAAVAGIVGYIASGTPTNEGTTSAIGAENAKIMIAERLSCREDGTYGTVPTLEREGLLAFKPVYNSVVYIPGRGCGAVVVGSPAYQAAAG
jgi:hypothetical protein